MRVAPMTHAPTQPSPRLDQRYIQSLVPRSIQLLYPSPNRIQRTLLERYALGFRIRIVDMETTTSRRRRTRVEQRS